MDRLIAFAESGTAATLYQKFLACVHNGKPRKLPVNPLLYVPTHPARALEDDLIAAELTKWGVGGKVDFHALRVAYVSFVLEAGATAKEAQSLARHSKPELTMNTYARARSDRLAELAEAVALNIKPAEFVALKSGTNDAVVNADTTAGTALLRQQPDGVEVAGAINYSDDNELECACADHGVGFKSRRPDQNFK